MTLFIYTATDSSGAKKSGIVDAHNESLAAGLLKNQGLYVINLEEKRESLLEGLLSFRGVSEGDVVTFTRQFSTMISSGLPLARSLEVLADQTSSRGLRKVILDCLRDVEGGASLSSALTRFPRVFNPTYRALVRAGESSGKLDEILKRLAETMEAERELSGKFKAAMVYPAIVMIAMVGVFVLMMVFVVPKLATLYKSLNVPLPFMTRAMIGVSNFMVSNMYILVIAFAGVVLGVRYFLRTDPGKELISFLSFNVPVFGRINKEKDIAQFTRTLSLLIASAIPIVEALKIVSDVVGNKAYKQAALDAALSVEKGNPLSEFLKHNKIFPPLLSQMASVGEETGQMDAVLAKVAGYFDGEIDNLVKGLSAALEPLILIFLGAMVAVLIISIITPIYKITSAL